MEPVQSAGVAAPSVQEFQDRVKRLVEKIPGLPTLPTMLSTINRLMINPNTSPKQIADLISSDPAITSKILRVVNSSFYGFPNRITTITHATVILGFSTIRSIVLSSAIFDMFKGDNKRVVFDRTAFWKHSIGCGAAARVIGRKLGVRELEELFIAGLLHDVGKILMDHFLNDKFQEILERVRSKNCLMLEAEMQLLGCTHADIGAWIFEKWNLPKGHIESTRCHHNPALAVENPKPAAVVHLADILVRALRFGSGGDNKIPPISETAWKTLGMATSDFPRLLAETDEEIQKAAIFLDFAK